MLLFVTFSTKAQQTHVLIDDLFQFNHQELQAKLENSSKETQLFYTNKMTFLQVLLNESPVSDSILDSYEKSISILEDISFNQPQLKWYYVGEAQLMLSLLQVKQGHQISSAKNFIRAYDSFEKNLKKHPNFKDPEVALRFMEISASLLPKSLQWITSWFGLKSDKDQAAKSLAKLYQSKELSPLAKKQCFALSLYLKYQLDIHTIEDDSYTPSALISLLKAELYGKQKQYPAAIKELNTLPNHLVLKHFLLGKAYFITGNPLAKQELLSFVKQSQTGSNITAAYFYLYQLDILNQVKNSEYKKRVLNINPEENYRDKWAKKEINTPQTAFLIKTRNSFDGGDYKTCINLLNTKSTFTKRELYYLTNSYIYLKQFKEAKQSFNRLINLGFKGEYYIPKTAYHLANSIHLRDKDYAIEILKTIDSYKNYPYQKEIEAKSGRLQKVLE